jgi:hypothetical protein
MVDVEPRATRTAVRHEATFILKETQGGARRLYRQMPSLATATPNAHRDSSFCGMPLPYIYKGLTTAPDLATRLRLDRGVELLLGGVSWCLQPSGGTPTRVSSDALN